jgi:hypothetical protein
MRVALRVARSSFSAAAFPLLFFLECSAQDGQDGAVLVTGRLGFDADERLEVQDSNAKPSADRDESALSHQFIKAASSPDLSEQIERPVTRLMAGGHQMGMLGLQGPRAMSSVARFEFVECHQQSLDVVRVPSVDNVHVEG